MHPLYARLREATEGHTPLVLAVSGGLDSMVLLECAAAAIGARVAIVATFDHGTGVHARRAAQLVRRRARQLGFAVEVGHGGTMGMHASEAALREARWAFLRQIARRCGADGSPAPVATAHTRDDQVETVLMRALRDAGARGMAGLAAPAPGIVRPWLASTRAELASYAAMRGVRWVDDPTNASPRYLRNRVRHALLPALRAAQPGLETALWETGRRAAAWRVELDALLPIALPSLLVAGGAVHVARGECRRYDYAGQAILWPALAARVGLALDRRGTARIARFITSDGHGRAIPLSGGWELARTATTVSLRRACGVARGAGRSDAAPARSGRPVSTIPRARTFR